MSRRSHERSLSYPTEGQGSLESSKSLESQYSLDSQASLRLDSQAAHRSKRGFPRSESYVNLRTGGRPPQDRRSLSPGPLARALSAQHSATTVNYGGIGALPMYKAYSQSVESSLDNSPTKVKELRKDASVQQSLRIRAAKAWLLQRWPLCIAALLLLTLLAAAALQFRSNGTDGAGAPGQQSILASMRGAQSIQHLPRTLRNNMAQLLSGKGLALRGRGEPLGVCIMTADFWGLRSAGGTATAYHLLAQALAATGDMRVTFLAVTRRYQQCQEGVQAQAAAASAIRYKCLAPEHFVPGVVETYPYESLSHASLAWLKSNLALCDVVHVHEWGGVFVDVITASAYRQLKPGLRVVVEAHGGHFWSTQGSVQRPLDVTSLRIDAQERMGLQLADALISPTHYMTAFLRERAWRLPKTSLVIPNVLPPAPTGQPALKGKVEKPVWRLAFFSRLEERKGLKVFVSAVKHLQEAAAGKLDARFEVVFVGADSRVDMLPSSDWLRAKTASWKVPVKILLNVERSEALALLDEEGTLLVMCSLIDNMPYVLAEAAVKGVPLISFDVGGIGEMLEYAEHGDVIVMESTAKALSQKLQEVLDRGKTNTVQLSNHMLEGRDSWLKWHRYYAQTLSPKIEQEDLSLMMRLQRSNQGTVRVVHLTEGQQSVALHDGICGPPGVERSPDWNPALPMLLLPAGYRVKDPNTAPALMSELVLVGKALDHGVGALSFGVELAGGEHSFPTGPTWHLYTGDDSRCMESVPLLLRKSTFCSSFFAHARVFRTYQSWVLIMMLRQAGLRVHTYPEVLFTAANLTAGGGDCNPDKPPLERHISFGSASNILGDPEEVMTNLYLAPFPRPATSLIADYPYEQGHKGWQVGYRADNGSEFRQLVWHPSREPGAKPSDGTWGCPNAAQPYPAMQHSLVHPCTATAQICCGLSRAAFTLRFQSFFAAPKAMLLMAYDMWPICGDGLTLQIQHTKAGSAAPEVLMSRRHPPGSHEKPQRQKVELKMPLHVGDVVDFIVDPHTNMDCDGVYIVDMQFWPDSGDTRTWES